MHVVHPLAGQGFNLILRDIEKLNELISNNLRLGLTIKDSNIPKDLSDSRKPENLLIGLGIDTTRKFFKSNKYLDQLKKYFKKLSKSSFFKKNHKKSREPRFKLMNIFALSSGRGPCGIAIIRISGPDTLSICKLISKEK